MGSTATDRHDDWSQEEVALAVADYFDMLRAELLGRRYSKAAHRQALLPRLSGRSPQSVEFKHCNISAVLVGEGFPYLERRRLQEHGRADLARKVQWISDTHGDGAGYDILSFDAADASERFVEVKTTGLGKFFPFYVTRNEVRYSEAFPRQYDLYRVFQFAKSPRVYVLSGALSKVCRLEAVQYRAVV